MREAGFFVRGAIQGDLEGILPGMQALSDRFGTRVPLYDEAEIRARYLDFIAFHPLFVATYGDEVVGFVGGFWSAHHALNSRLRVLVEAFWWADKSFRGYGRVALALLDRFTAYGRSCADWIYFTLMANLPLGERALARRGYKLAQGNYLLEVD